VDEGADAPHIVPSKITEDRDATNSFADAGHSPLRGGVAT